jgi:hypothetical protein
VIYALCLIGATINHIRAVAAQGWLPAYLPQATAAYWASLTFLDPLVAALLFIRPRAGIAATLAIILSDVTHNLWFAAAYSHSTSIARAVATNPFLLSQIGFLLFVALTTPVAWRELSEELDSRRIQ